MGPPWTRVKPKPGCHLYKGKPTNTWNKLLGATFKEIISQKIFLLDDENYGTGLTARSLGRRISRPHPDRISMTHWKQFFQFQSKITVRTVCCLRFLIYRSFPYQSSKRRANTIIIQNKLFLRAVTMHALLSSQLKFTFRELKCYVV